MLVCVIYYSCCKRDNGRISQIVYLQRAAGYSRNNQQEAEDGNNRGTQMKRLHEHIECHKAKHFKEGREGPQNK